MLKGMKNIGTESRQLTTIDDTMVANWPDAVNCGEGIKAIFMLHGAGQNGAYYVQVYPNEYRHVIFNGNGEFVSRAGHDASSRGCEGSTIADLRQGDKAFNFVSSREQDAQGLTSIVANFPDALRCGVDPTEGAIFMPHGVGKGGHYTQVYPNEDRSVTFNENGDFISRRGHDSSSAGCEGKTISELYQEGRGANFVSSREQDSQGLTSMMTNYPDAIRCGEVPTDAAIFMLQGADSNGVYYAQVFSGEYRHVIFNENGEFVSRAGHDASSRGCEGRTIPELYQEGRAFNFVNNRVLSESDDNSEEVDVCAVDMSGHTHFDGFKNLVFTEKCDVITASKTVSHNIYLGGGNDRFVSSTTANFVDAGSGIDTYVAKVNENAENVIIDANKGKDSSCNNKFEGFEVFKLPDCDNTFIASSETIKVIPGSKGNIIHITNPETIIGEAGYDTNSTLNYSAAELQGNVGLVIDLDAGNIEFN